MSSVLTTAWARLLLGSFLRAGVSDVVISPGSRSTPFTWAALNTEGLSCHAAPDERSAAFFALGQARVSGKPSLLLCTSGSAAAHYFPAIVEAAHAFVPMLVLTADRPFELMDCGAAQAMDQTKLYGDHVRQFFELGHPDASDAALDALVRKVAQAVARSEGPLAGPVHLNARARKPLEPAESSSTSDVALARAVQLRLERGPTRVVRARRRLESSELADVLGACKQAQSGLIVCGPLPAHGRSAAAALFELARRTGFALYAEATSQARASAPNDGELTLLGSPDAAFANVEGVAPDLVLQVGSPPTASIYERWLAETKPRRAVVAASGWLDPSNGADWLVEADALTFTQALNERSPQPSPELRESRRTYRGALAAREAMYWRIVESVLRESGGAAALNEAHAVELAIASLPSGGLLGLGNSLALRDVDSFVPPPAEPLHVWSQRGVNGIDGLIAGASGAALAARRPSLLLLGDVSALHDIGSLFLARSVTTPFVVCVLDNAGGRIFEELPLRGALENRPELAAFWLTPPGIDFRKVAEAFGVAYWRADTAAALSAALSRAFERGGCSLVHAVLEPTSAREARSRVRARLQAELSTV